MKRTSLILIAALAAVAAVVAASASGAGITVFKTSFDTKADFEAIKTLDGGKLCKRDWRDESALGVTVKSGPVACAVSTPVSGDGAQPDQIVRVVAKVNKDTDDKVKKTMFVGAIVRASRKESYELRVYPKARRFELLKSGEVLDDGREKSIEGLAEKNRLEISAIGSTITVKVNGDALATFRDKDADQVEGRQTGLSFGNAGKSKKGIGVALFDKLKVQLPIK